MTRIGLIFLFLCLSQKLHSQYKADTTCYSKNFNSDTTEKIFTALEIKGSFKNGNFGWRKFIEQHASFVKIIPSIPDSVQFLIDSVTIKFIISKDKVISDFILLDAQYNETKNEMIRLLKLSSCYWYPGIIGGRLLNAYHIETIYFIIDKSGGKYFTGFRLKGSNKIRAINH